MRTIVAKLQSQGHHVDFYVRKDGGILIKNIDGQRFTKGASGNIVARQMAGEEISEARLSQLKYATRARKFKHPTLDDEVQREWQRVKKKWNKAFKSKGGKPHKAGYFGWNRIAYTLKQYGREEALRRIHEAEKYTTGIAYKKNVMQLVVHTRNYAEQFDSNSIRKLADDIEENAYMIEEDWIVPAYDELYKLDKGVPIDEVVANVRKVLRLEKLK